MRLYLILTQDGAQQVQAQNAEQAIAEYYIRAKDETENRGKVIQKVLGVLDNRYLAPFSGDWPGVKSIDGRRLVPEEAASILAYCLQEKVTAFDTVLTYGKAKAAEYEAEIARLKEDNNALKEWNDKRNETEEDLQNYLSKFYYEGKEGRIYEHNDFGNLELEPGCPLWDYIVNLENKQNHKTQG